MPWYCKVLSAEGLYLLCRHGNKPLLSYQQGPLETITHKVDPLYMEANIRMGYSTLYSVNRAMFGEIQSMLPTYIIRVLITLLSRSRAVGSRL